MTDKNYRKVLSQYKELKEKQKSKQEAEEKLHDLTEERLMFENSKFVRQYISVLEAIKKNDKIANQNIADDDTFFDEITNQFYGENETNNIYVYMGAYTYSILGSEIVEILRDSYIEDGWNEYKDIEKNDIEDVIRTEAKQFEEENIVLFAPKGVDTEDFYKLVRRTFFKYAIEFGQEEAVRKIKEEFAAQSIEEPIKREREKKQ